MLAEPFYCAPSRNRPSRRKPLLRGLLHKLALLTSPFWLLQLSPRVVDQCSISYSVLCWGSFWVMFLSSSFYHHFKRSQRQHEQVKAIDMTVVAATVLCNMTPTLVYLKLWNDLLVYCAIMGVIAWVLLSSVSGTSVHVKTLFCGMVALVLIYSICFVIPHVARGLPGTSWKGQTMQPLVAQLLIFLATLALFVFSDEDRFSTRARSRQVCGIRVALAGTHDILHLMSLLYFWNFAYWNYWVINDLLCPPLAQSQSLNH